MSRRRKKKTLIYRNRSFSRNEIFTDHNTRRFFYVFIIYFNGRPTIYSESFYCCPVNLRIISSFNEYDFFYYFYHYDQGTIYIVK